MQRGKEEKDEEMENRKNLQHTKWENENKGKFHREEGNLLKTIKILVVAGWNKQERRVKKEMLKEF